MANSTEEQVPDQESFRKYCTKRMDDKKEFIKLFYEVIYQSAFEGKDLTHRQVFNLLNNIYFKLTGKFRYKNYETFYFTKIRMDNIVLRITPNSGRN
jgi:hypothetical protein